jgi:hypothetical protein
VKKTLNLKSRGLNTSKDTLNFEPNELMQMGQGHRSLAGNLDGKEGNLSQLSVNIPQQTRSPQIRYIGPPCLNAQIYRSLIDSAKMKSRDNSLSSRKIEIQNGASQELISERTEGPSQVLPGEKFQIERLRYKRAADAIQTELQENAQRKEVRTWLA